MSILSVQHGVPIWRIVRSREEFNRPDLPVLTVISESGVQVRDFSAGGRAVSEDLRGYRVVRSGDLVVNRLWARFGAYGISPVDGIISPAYWVLQLDHNLMHPPFAHYLLRSSPYLAEIGRISKNLPPNGFDLPWEQFRRVLVECCPLAEQRAIADFLDSETARIDALIEKKRRQSVLVDARWGALITDLVRGRQVASQYKESGVEWIGALPVEWGTPTVGMMFDVELGKMLNQRAAEGENQLRYLRNQNVQWDSFDLKDVSTMHFDPGQLERFRVRKGDLLVCEGGDVGRAAMWSSEDDIYYQKALHRVRPRTTAPSRFLMYVLWAASSLGVFTIEGNQSTIVHFTREQLRAHRIPWPPEEQQRQIVVELDKARAKMRNLQEKWSRQIQLLTEHRQALITAAVTGEIEVPGSAAPS